MAPTVLTIVLNYRTAEFAAEAARAALREMDGIPGGVTIVDNDSRDGSYERLTKAFMDLALHSEERLRIIRSPENGGYGAGNNLGIRLGLPGGRRPDYVYILNPDARPGAGAIRALLEHLEANPRVAFAGSYIQSPDGEPHRTAFRFPGIASEFETTARIGPVTRLLASRIVAMPIPEATCEVDWVAGASIMLRSKALEAIGLFDEKFFLYFEETDLCRRARLAGWTVAYVHESRALHEGSVSTGMKTWTRIPGYWFDSRRHYFIKHHGRAYAGAATLARVAGTLLSRVRAQVERKPRSDPQRALRDLIGHSLAGARPFRAAGPSSETGIRRIRLHTSALRPAAHSEQD